MLSRSSSLVAAFVIVNAVSFPAHADDTAPTPKSKSPGAFRAGVALTSIGATLLTAMGAFWLVAATAERGDAAGTAGTILIGANCGVAGLSTLVPGIVMMARNSGASDGTLPTKEPTWVGAQKLPMAHVAPVVPIFVTSF